jgi:hypothetical protein
VCPGAAWRGASLGVGSGRAFIPLSLLRPAPSTAHARGPTAVHADSTGRFGWGAPSAAFASLRQCARLALSFPDATGSVFQCNMPGMRRAPCDTSSMQHAVCSVHRAAQRAPLTGVIMFNLGNTYAEERNYPLSIKSGPRTTRLPEYPWYPGYPEYREYLITRTEYPQSRHPPLRCSQVFPKDDRNCAAVRARVPLPRPGRSLLEYPDYPEYPEYPEYPKYLTVRARVPLPRPGRPLRDGMATLASWCSVA